MILNQHGRNIVINAAVTLINENIREKPSNTEYLQSFKSSIVEHLRTEDHLVFNPAHPNGLKEVLQEYQLSKESFTEGFEVTINLTQPDVIHYRSHHLSRKRYLTAIMVKYHK
jgi:hypothetical protein